MVKIARRAALVAVAFAAALLTAGPAVADTPPTSTPTVAPTGPSGYACLDEKAGYAASGVCQLVVVKAVAVCQQGLPWLDYEVQAQGTPNTTTTLVWGDVNGQHYTQADLPLKGTVLWPGAVLDAQGNAADWPGWTLQSDGTWVRGDEWNWVRPSVPVTFQVNPEATVTVAYPPEQAACANPPQSAVLAAEDPTSSAVLAATGSSDAQPLLLGAAGLLLVGSLFLGLRAAHRRRAATR